MQNDPSRAGGEVMSKGTTYAHIHAVIPAQAGIHLGPALPIARRWIPAFAGMTPWV